MLFSTGTSSIALIGAGGFGLVWGWLAALLVGRTHRKVVTTSAISLASILAALQVLWMLGIPAAATAIGAALLSLAIHAAWRGRLRREVDQSNPNPGGNP